MNHFLRNLTSTQQVAALFLAVFGFLVLVSVTAFLMTFRKSATVHDEAWHDELKNFRKLLKTSWIMVVVFWLAWATGDTVATVLFALIAFFGLREFITLSPTRRGDHRSLVLAFFIVLPIQFWLVATQHFDLFTVFIPVYVFLAIPVVSALSGDPQRFLERNAKLQWGIMVCVYGMSHVPALLLLNFKGYEGKGAFLVFFLV
jgi:phosphatidate cytidylyltransferase